MIIVTLACRDCDSDRISFASKFEPNERTKIRDTQQHMDTHFLARCGNCFACNWEVENVRKAEFAHHRN